jgi:hypothetical protein
LLRRRRELGGGRLAARRQHCPLVTNALGDGTVAGALHLDIGPAGLGNAADALHSLLNIA